MGLAFIASPANAVGTMIATALALTGTTAVIVATAINIAVSMIIAKNAASGLDGALSGQSQNPGNRQSIPPATDNKLPVVYGTAWMGGTITDMSISTDNQWIYYVISLSEVTNNGTDYYTFGDVYFGGRKCVFSSTNPYQVTGLQDPSTLITDSAVNGNLYVYLYRNGTSSNVNSPYTAYQIMNGGGAFSVNLTYRWTSQQMTNCAFAIVQMKYSQTANITGFQQMKFQVINPRNAPGDCFQDYLTNETYGAGIDISQVDTASLTALNTYCAGAFSYTPASGGTATQNRFQFNGVLDTSRTIMDNLQEMATSCDCLLKYNEVTGLWGVIVQQPTYTVAMDINDSNMIGSITVSPLDISTSYNVIEAKFPDKTNQDSFNSATFDLSQLAPTLLYPNEPINKQSVTLSLVNNNVTAQYIANRLLEAGREDLNITCKITYVGLQLEAGDIVTVTNTNYGWSAKLFRITKVTEQFGSDGTITADLMLSEYNPQVFDDQPITQFTPAPNTGLPSALTFGTLAAPIITGASPTAAVPYFLVNITTPNNGVVQYAEIYYSAYSAPTSSQLIFVGTTDVKPSGNTYAAGEAIPAVTVTGVASGNWYFFYKVVNSLGTSGLSSPSSILYWRPMTFQYANQYLMLAYATNSTGTTGFSFNPRNTTYFGIYSTTSVASSTNPADYTWFPASPNFNTTNYLLYAGWGNRSISFATGTANYYGGATDQGSFVSTVLAYPAAVWSGVIDPASTNIVNFSGDFWLNATGYDDELQYLNPGSLSTSLIGQYVTGAYIPLGTTVLNVYFYSGSWYLQLSNPVTTTTPYLSEVVSFYTPSYTQSYIDLDKPTGQIVLTGSTTSYGSLAVQPSTDGRLQVALNKFIDFGQSGGADILQKTVQPAYLTIDIYGRVVGFEYPDNFYMTVQNYTATSGQTVFSTTRASDYVSGNCLVFQNGMLVDTSEYTDTNGSTGTVTFSSGRTLNDKLTIISFRSYHLATAGAFVIGRTYTIVSVGSTNFTAIGASSNTVGVVFTATGVGSGTGTASNIYNSFTRFTQSVSNVSTVTPTTPITSGFEFIFFNGTAMLDPDYDIDVNGNIINLPANVTGQLTCIQWAANNLSTPNGNPYVVLANTATGQVNYTFGLTQYGFNLYENGVFQVNGTTTTAFTPNDYTTVSGGYTLANTPTSSTNFLLQQSFTRTGAA